MQSFLRSRNRVATLALVAGASIWVVSFFTNLVGARWIFGEQGSLPIISSLFALAISITLLLAAWYLARCLRRQRELRTAVPAYIVVFSISLAFTYQALFLRFSLDSENEEGRLRISHSVESFRTSYEVCLRKSWDLDRKESDLARLKEETDFEKSRADRPGEGILYLQRLQEQRRAEVELEDLRNRISARLGDLTKASQELKGTDVSSLATDAAQVLTAGINNMKADGCDPPEHDAVARVTAEAKSKRSPLYAFQRLIGLTEPRLPVMLAICIGFFLELIPLVLFVMLEKDNSPLDIGGSGNRKTDEVWERIIKG